MSRHWAKLLLTMGFAVAAGCQGTQFPRFGRQPPSRVQRYQAQQFDPYPEVDISNNSNKVDGIRPRDFVDPPAEATRGRWWQFGQQRYSPDAGQ
ncbi:MAG TPA: hypothetical protein VG433_03110 [Pirellulales bacterium]|jgi:hypothetical protein|nr:hypothetical protein [Pirellulales bacterium]